MIRFITIEDFLEYLNLKGYNWALGSNGQLHGNYPANPDGSYFLIKGIIINKDIKEQDKEVKKELSKLIIN